MGTEVQGSAATAEPQPRGSVEKVPIWNGGTPPLCRTGLPKGHLNLTPSLKKQGQFKWLTWFCSAIEPLVEQLVL